MSSVEFTPGFKSSPESLVPNEISLFFEENKQLFLNALEMSLLTDEVKEDCISYYDRFIKDVQRGDKYVKAVMKYFDEKGTQHTPKKEDGAWDIEAIINILLIKLRYGALRYRTGEMGNPSITEEKEQICQHLREEFYKQASLSLPVTG